MEALINRIDRFFSVSEINVRINRINTWLLLVVIFSLYYLGFVPGSNEEQYMQLAKAFLDRDWIRDSDVFSESAGTRLLYQYIIGFFLHCHRYFQVDPHYNYLIRFK